MTHLIGKQMSMLNV